MSVSSAQRVCNLFVRALQKPTLRWVAHQPTLRVLFEAQAALTYRSVRTVSIARKVLGSDLRARRIVPPNSGRGRLLYIHGGGFTIGSSATHKWLAARLAEGMNVTALVPDYRLAPRYPFPAALDDCVTAYEALLDEAAPERIAVAGDSAGGALALSLLNRLNDAGLPPPAALGLLSPVTDLTFTSESVRRFHASDPLIPIAWGQRAVRAYLAGHPAKDPAVSPLFADLSKAPPTLVQVAEGEILLDDSLRLRGLMPEVTIERWDGVPHVWQLFAGWTPEADRAVAKMAAFLAGRLS